MTRLHVVVKCPVCKRTESWYPPATPGHPPYVEVETPGGDRLPAVAGPLATWRILKAARDGASGPIVGKCDACGQPMVADEPGLPVHATPWPIPIDGGTVVVADEITGPGGKLSVAEADALIERHYRSRFKLEPARLFFTVALLAVIAAPLLLWLLTGTIAVRYLFYALGHGS